MNSKSCSFGICPLADRPDVLPVVAEWIYREWSFIYAGKPRQYVENILRRRLHKRKLPLTLVAFKKGRPVGTVSLKEFDLEKRRDLRYWITSLFVIVPERGQGIGRALMRAAEERAAQAGITTLTLFTADRGLAVRLYERLGWKMRETTGYGGYEIFIMEKDLPAELRTRRTMRAA